MAEFTWVPDNGASRETEFKVRKAQFGDGYSQRVGDGINTMGGTYPLSFTNKPSVVDEIEAFLEQRKGTTAFTFRPPRASADIKVVCVKWSRNFTNAYVDKLTCEFERVYE